jgi:hypothetical protein
VRKVILESQRVEANRVAREATQALERARVEAVSRLREAQFRRRLWLFVMVTAGASTLAGVALSQWSKSKTEQAVAESNGAQLKAALEQQQKIVADTEKVIDVLERALNIARQEAVRTGNLAFMAKLETSVRALGSEVRGDAAGRSPAADDAAPRVYLHIGNDGQRAAATAFGRLLAQQGQVGQRIVVPGTQLVAGQRNDGVLRCFRAAECRDEAPRLLASANSLLDSPKLTLQDLSPRYEANPPRPHHFEIWFGNAEVQLSGPARAAASVEPAASR